MHTSIWSLIGLPGQFGITLLAFSFVLTLAPYFSNTDFGMVKIPEIPPQRKKQLKYLGPLFFIIMLVVHIPLISTNDIAYTHKVSIDGFPVLNFRERPITLEEIKSLEIKKKEQPGYNDPGLKAALPNNTPVELIDDSDNYWALVRITLNDQVVQGYVFRWFNGQPTLIPLTN